MIQYTKDNPNKLNNLGDLGDIEDKDPMGHGCFWTPVRITCGLGVFGVSVNDVESLYFTSHYPNGINRKEICKQYITVM